MSPSFLERLRARPWQSVLAVTGGLVGCGAQTPPEARPPSVIVVPPTAPHPPAPGTSETASTADAWDPSWVPVEAFHGAGEVFDLSLHPCATTPSGVRCQDSSSELGPLASTEITSPTSVWGYIWLCGVDRRGAFVCSHPFADRPSLGPPRLNDVVSADIHAAAHRDGTLSVTTNRAAVGYSEPRWDKVRAVNDAVQVASSWSDVRSCYVRRSGAVACVENAVGATPKPIAGVTDAARIWKTDAALWILSRSGRLSMTPNLEQPPVEVATKIVSFAPVAAVPGAVESKAPCAVDRDERLLCALESSKLVPVPGAGKARAVFGDSRWICAKSADETVRCILEKPKSAR